MGEEREPTEGELAALAGALGVERLVSDGRIGGGIASWTSGLTALNAEGPRSLVMKRYVDSEWSGATTAAELEWERLHVALAAPVPTPEPLLFDAIGALAGLPAIVMTRLPGAPLQAPPDTRRWVEELAEGLAAVHSTPIRPPVPAVLARPHGLTTWEPWETTSPLLPAIVEAINELRQRVVARPLVFCHNDYHPGNVLFDDGRLSGIIDWSGARLAPRWSDVADCRTDLALVPGEGVHDDFAQAYAEAVGEEPVDLARWDVLYGAAAMRYSAGWAPAFIDQGIDITGDELVARAEAFVADALSRC